MEFMLFLRNISLVIEVKNEKGFTILELLISLIIIGITSSIVILSINSYQTYLKENTNKKKYYDECMKLYSILVMVNKDQLAKKTLEFNNNRYEVYLDGKLAVSLHDNIIKYHMNTFKFEFVFINKLKLEIKDRFLYAFFDSIYGNDYIMVRWNNG